MTWGDAESDSEGVEENRVRVLLLSFDSEELSIRLASGLADYCDVTLMLPGQRAEPYLKHLDSRVDFQPFYRPRLRQAIQQIRMVSGLLRRIRELDPEVIHIQKWHLWFYIALPLLRSYPVVISIHDPSRHSGDAGQEKTPTTIVNFGYRQADRVIAHNDQMKTEITADLGIPADRIDVIPLIERGDATLSPDVQESGNEVLFFGRIWAYKGLDVFIRAQPLISEGFPDAQFLIAGRGDDFDQYESLMAAPEKFEVHNRFVPESEQATLFRRASVVVLPYWDATQSGVIPVAYTFSKPVVATDVGGLSSQVDDGVTGILVPRGDHRALAEATVRLLRDPDLRRRMGDRGRQKLESEWSGTVVARRTVDTYRKLLSDPAQSNHS